MIDQDAKGRKSSIHRAVLLKATSIERVFAFIMFKARAIGIPEHASHGLKNVGFAPNRKRAKLGGARPIVDDLSTSGDKLESAKLKLLTSPELPHTAFAL